MLRGHSWILDFYKPKGSFHNALLIWNEDPFRVVVALDIYFHYRCGRSFCLTLRKEFCMHSWIQYNPQTASNATMIEYIRRKPGPTTAVALITWRSLRSSRFYGSRMMMPAQLQFLEDFTLRVPGGKGCNLGDNILNLWSHAKQRKTLSVIVARTLWEENRKLLKQVKMQSEHIELQKEQLEEIKAAGPCVSYRNSLEKQVS